MQFGRIALDLTIPVLNRTVMTFLNQFLTILLSYCRVKHVEFFFENVTKQTHSLDLFPKAPA